MVALVSVPQVHNRAINLRVREQVDHVGIAGNGGSRVKKVETAGALPLGHHLIHPWAARQDGH